MTGHHSVPHGRRVVVWFLSGRVVLDRFDARAKRDGVVSLAALGDVPVRRLRRMTLYRADRPLPHGTELRA